MLYRSGLGPNESLLPGEYLLSDERQYMLILQTDGNLVLYPQNGSAMWSTHTENRRSARCTMQADGNLVIYDVFDHPVWSSNTCGHGGAYLVLQDDGNLVMYSQGAAKWATHTVREMVAVP
ncbi:MAG TPA: hypothetical protein VMH04_16620 [Candidatus Solibacter sp.]|nr:hypothetical protein [Candidatus Solibacter sp.]